MRRTCSIHREPPLEGCNDCEALEERADRIAILEVQRRGYIGGMTEANHRAEQAEARIAELEAELKRQQSDFDSVWESRDQALRERDTLKAQLATVTYERDVLAGWRQGAEESAEVMRREFHAAQAFGAQQLAELERLRGALIEAPMVALGRTNTAFARWCMEQAQPTGQEVRP